MLEFHHFGIACTDIAVLAQDYEKLGYTVEGAPFVDEIQKIKGLFITGGGPRLELLAAHNNSTVLTPWLSSGPRIYHQAFWVDDINQAVKHFISNNARVLVEPVPAVAFGNRKICFVMTRSLTLLELISRE